ncbi:MAG: carbohydrate kinase family protein [Rhizobiaceae bacterium]
MILCCGEALIDMLPTTSPEGRAAFVPVPGGAVFNTAIALGRLGARSGLWCGLSNDLFGQRLDEALRHSNVSAALCPRSDRPTTLAFVTLTDGQARYAFYDENTAARMVTPQELPELPDEVSAMFFGGISLAVEPCGSAHEALLRREAENRLIMMDPNIRPGFIRDEEAYRARLSSMMARSDIVKLSDEDMEWLFPDTPEDGVVESLWSGGATSVFLVTRGAAGATCHLRGGKRIDCGAPSITVADTVGAGDTFNAGFLCGLARADALSRSRLAQLSDTVLEGCLALAVGAAAITASRRGADSPWAHEVRSPSTSSG